MSFEHERAARARHGRHTGAEHDSTPSISPGKRARANALQARSAPPSVIQQRAASRPGALPRAGALSDHHGIEMAVRPDLYGGGPLPREVQASRGPSTPSRALVQMMRKDLRREATISSNGNMVVLGHRKQLLYATREKIEEANQALSKSSARIKLETGPRWSGDPSKELLQVLPIVINGEKPGEGVSDTIVHPILERLMPLASDSPEEKQEKARKYTAFWKQQQTKLLHLSTAILLFQNKKYTHRLEEEPPRPRPGFTPAELLSFVTAQKSKLAGDGYAGSFFKILVDRHLIEGLTSFNVAMRDKAIAGKDEAITAKVLENRRKERDRPKGEDEVLFEEEEAYYEDLGAHPAGPLEVSPAKDGVYSDLLAEQYGYWEDSGSAATFLRDAITKLQDQIAAEIESDGDVMIAVRRCSDMTRFIYSGQKLETIPLNQAGGRFHYAADSAQGRVFHSAGIIMSDGSDMVTLEAANGSGELPASRNAWWFQMYGSGEDSFDEQTKKRWDTIG